MCVRWFFVKKRTSSQTNVDECLPPSFILWFWECVQATEEEGFPSLVLTVYTRDAPQCCESGTTMPRIKFLERKGMGVGLTWDGIYSFRYFNKRLSGLGIIICKLRRTLMYDCDDYFIKKFIKYCYIFMHYTVISTYLQYFAIICLRLGPKIKF